MAREDGLDFYRRIVKDSKTHLNDNGILLLKSGMIREQRYQICLNIRDIVRLRS